MLRESLRVNSDFSLGSWGALAAALQNKEPRSERGSQAAQGLLKSLSPVQAGANSSPGKELQQWEVKAHREMILLRICLINNLVPTFLRSDFIYFDLSEICFIALAGLLELLSFTVFIKSNSKEFCHVQI